MKKIPYFFFLLLAGLIHAQTPIASIGIQLNGGRMYSKSGIVDPNPYALIRKDVLSMGEIGLFVEKRIKLYGISLASGYSYQRLKFEDPNVEYFSSGEEQLIYSYKSSGIYSNLGISRYLTFSNALSAYGKFGFRAQFNSSSSAETSSEMTTLLGSIPVTTTFKANPFSFGICPEIGIQINKKNHAWTFFAQQNFGLSGGYEGKNYRTILTNQVDQSEFNSALSFTNIGVRYSFNINKKEKTEHLVAKERKEKKEKPKKDSVKTEDTKKLTYDENGLPKTLDNRPIEKQNEVIVHSTEIEFFVWDDKQEDQDSISLYINGKWVLQQYEITKKKKSVKITIDPNSDNYLIMYALNLGKFPPNTCAISIDDGSGEKRIYLKSSLENCGALQFRYKPKN